MAAGPCTPCAASAGLLEIWLRCSNEQRFGSACPERNPFLARKKIFIAINGDEFSTLNGLMDSKPAPRFASNSSFLLPLDCHIDTVRMKLPRLFFEALQNFALRFPLGGHQLGHKQACQYADFLRHVPFYGQPSRLLTTDDDWLLLHQGADVFESNRCFMDFYAKEMGHCIYLVA